MSRSGVANQSRKVNSGLAISLLILGVVVSSLALVYAMDLKSPLVQMLVVLVSMGIAFYCGHPLGHFLTARAYGVGTEYFFLGRSDFRKLEMRPMRVAGRLLPTIGTKLKKSELLSLPPRKKGYVLGSGVIFSITLAAIQLVYVFIAGFSLLAVIFAALFLVATLATELLFSTEVGDLAKMTGEFKKTHSP